MALGPFGPTPEMGMSFGLGPAGVDIADLGDLEFTHETETLPFDDTYTLYTNSVYTVTMNANVSESADPAEVLNATIDPQAFIEPAFLDLNPGFFLAFSPGFPGSPTHQPVPDAASTVGLLALGMGGLAALRRQISR